MSFGFGPLHASAVTARPPARSDAIGQQTWFKDASAAGATDGTVLDASWLNHILGNLIYLCQQAGIDPANDQQSDAHVYQAVAALIGAAVQNQPGLTSVETDTTLQGDGTVGAPLGLSAVLLSQIALIPALQTAIANEQLRALAAEAALSARIATLEAGDAPRATLSQYGFTLLGSTGGGGNWVLI